MCRREDDYVDIPYIFAASPHSLWGRHSCSRQSSSNIPRRSPVHLGRRSGKSGSSGYSWARPGYAATRSSYCSCCRTMTGAAEGRPGRACGRRTAAGSRVGVVRSLPCGFVLLYKGGGEMGWAVRVEHPTASSACCVFTTRRSGEGCRRGHEKCAVRLACATNYDAFCGRCSCTPSGSFRCPPSSRGFSIGKLGQVILFICDG